MNSATSTNLELGVELRDLDFRFRLGVGFWLWDLGFEVQRNFVLWFSGVVEKTNEGC